MTFLTRGLVAATVAAGLILTATHAKAEGKITVSEQFGTLYVPLNVVRDQKLIEKHGKAAGIDIKVEWSQLSGGPAINDALLAGSIDIASAGIGPFLTLWDRTDGAVKIVGALGAQPNFFLTNRPEINSLKDIKPEHRIATPAAIVSVQARTLQIAAEKEFGVGQHTRFDKNSVTLPHPDATAALLSGSTEVVMHISNSPFQDQALKDPKIKKLFSSYDVVGGQLTPTLVYAALKFRKDNPKTYKAFVDAFEEATAWVDANKRQAAEIYVRVSQSKADPASIVEQLSDKDVKLTTVPSRTFVFAEFMQRTGAIKRKAASWKDYTFEELHGRSGS